MKSALVLSLASSSLAMPFRNAIESILGTNIEKRQLGLGPMFTMPENPLASFSPVIHGPVVSLPPLPDHHVPAMPSPLNTDAFNPFSINPLMPTAPSSTGTLQPIDPTDSPSLTLQPSTKSSVDVPQCTGAPVATGAHSSPSLNSGVTSNSTMPATATSPFGTDVTSLTTSATTTVMSGPASSTKSTFDTVSTAPTPVTVTVTRGATTDPTPATVTVTLDATTSATSSLATDTTLPTTPTQTMPGATSTATPEPVDDDDDAPTDDADQNTPVTKSSVDDKAAGNDKAHDDDDNDDDDTSNKVHDWLHMAEDIFDLAT
ncbi:hypothetical protein BDU57DRAFT_350975 [Ampelomyces quisqualis]|uniref:Uncharacterized protein n=1 Tax=Ampelomyces quisqualis TaxID=50730 RepID=A0A6A5QD68_AMPQU|nr:hypothetical protein BDU57DRAFT_350975 [Ampelomyces quisqualis]